MKSGSFYQNYREVRLLIVHCSATRCNRDFPLDALRRSHLSRGFASIGYHFYITREGKVHICRPTHQIGAHVTGWNYNRENETYIFPKRNVQFAAFFTLSKQRHLTTI